MEPRVFQADTQSRRPKEYNFLINIYILKKSKKERRGWDWGLLRKSQGLGLWRVLIQNVLSKQLGYKN